MVSEKFSKDFKNSKFLQRMYGSLIFLHPAISQFSIAHISFNIACKELKKSLKNVGNDDSKEPPTHNKLLLERLFV